MSDHPFDCYPEFVRDYPNRTVELVAWQNAQIAALKSKIAEGRNAALEEAAAVVQARATWADARGYLHPAVSLALAAAAIRAMKGEA